MGVLFEVSVPEDFFFQTSWVMVWASGDKMEAPTRVRKIDIPSV